MKHLEIEWRHLDKEGQTCLRCSDTGAALKTVIDELAAECGPRGWRITFRETPLGPERIAESNMILLNGTPIEDVLPRARVSESACPSCGTLTGVAETCCRTLEFENQSHEGIPASLIRRAVCTLAKCC